MHKVLVLIVASCLVACSAAPKAVHKTTNPPVTASAADASESSDAGHPSLVLTFEQFGCTMTLPNDHWKASMVQQDDGTSFLKIDLEGTSVSLFLRPDANPSEAPLKVLAEMERLSFASQSGQSVSDLRDDGGGRWVFTVESSDPGSKNVKALAYSVPIPNRTDVHFSMAIIGIPEEVDAHYDEAHGIIESLKPLPTK
jgi:hypothetical protein